MPPPIQKRQTAKPNCKPLGMVICGAKLEWHPSSTPFYYTLTVWIAGVGKPLLELTIKLDDVFSLQNGRLGRKTDSGTSGIILSGEKPTNQTGYLKLALGDFRNSFILETLLPYDTQLPVSQIGQPGHSIPKDWRDDKYKGRYALLASSTNLNSYLFWDSVNRKIIYPTSKQLLSTVSQSVVGWKLKVQNKGSKVALIAVIMLKDGTLAEQELDLTEKVGWKGNADEGSFVFGDNSPALWANGLSFDIQKNEAGQPSITAVNSKDKPVKYLALNKLVKCDAGNFSLKTDNKVEKESYFDSLPIELVQSLPGFSAWPLSQDVNNGNWDKFKYDFAKFLNTTLSWGLGLVGGGVGGVAGVIIGNIGGVVAGMLIEGMIKGCITPNSDWYKKIEPITLKRIQEECIIGFLGGKIGDRIAAWSVSGLKAILDWAAKTIGSVIKPVLQWVMNQVITTTVGAAVGK
ncbi:hypothetical protein ABW19_dt0203030 [Dactylella cylindrospora]|nr:hypothetical protein ABW19_dt0203030 [Dactylella cylindrospora]